MSSTVVVGSIWHRVHRNADSIVRADNRTAKVVSVLDHNDERWIIFEKRYGVLFSGMEILEIKAFRTKYAHPSEGTPE